MTIAILGGLLAVTTGLVLHRRGLAGVRLGLLTSYRMLRSVAHLMALGMLLAAMTQIILPADLISQWMGADAGLTGIIIGTILGAVVPGGPYVILPLAGSIMASGAGVGAMAAFITAWSVIPVTRGIMFEIPFLGARSTIARYMVALPFPFVAGVLAPPVFALLT